MTTEKSQGAYSETFLLFVCCTSVPPSCTTVITYERICNLTSGSGLCFKHPWALEAIDSLEKSWCAVISPQGLLKKIKSLLLEKLKTVWRGRQRSFLWFVQVALQTLFKTCSLMNDK